MKTIILLHGAIGAKDQLEPLAIELEQLGYHILTFSFSGHGKAPFADKFGIEQFAFELEHFINENSLNKPSVFGYSMGGYVALYLAFTKPNLLGSIMTFATKFEWNPEISQKEIKMLDSKTIIEKVPKFAEVLKARHGEQWKGLLQKTAEMMIDLGNKNNLFNDKLSLIENRILIGLGDKDTMVTLNETLTVYKKLKFSSLYVLPNTQHPIEKLNLNLMVKIMIDYF